MKKILITLTLVLMLTLSACNGEAGITPASSEITYPTNQTNTYEVSTPVSADFEDEDFAGASTGETTHISLDGESIMVDGIGVTVEGSIATIVASGIYELSGTLSNGQIVVDSQDTESVTLLLAGVDIHNESSAPIYVINAEKLIITLASNTQNNISDGASYINLDENGEPNAAIFSHDDMTINGDGALSVTANYNNGITSKDDLKITGGKISVTAVNDGIKGKDSVSIKDGVITINAGADGIQSTNGDEVEKGFVVIEGGVLNIYAGLDGIQSETNLAISDGDLTISASSGKGINAGIDLSITGGSFEIDSMDDALHANTNLTIDGGIFQLATGDDGVRSEISLTINGGELNITQALEGLESERITINDGYVHLITSDDGINATASGSGENSDGSYVNINGGFVLVDSAGDGLDSNGNAVMTGGFLIVQGPTMNNNGPLDVNGELEVSGGLLIVAGSAGMPEIPSTESAQNSIAVVLDVAQPGGTIIHLETLDGKEILTYLSPKEFQLFEFSSPELQMNTTYVLYVGGTATGTITNGVYTDGTYTAGTQVTSFEITSNLTTYGNFENGTDGRGGGHP